MTTARRAIEPIQIRLIHVALHELGIQDEEYRALLLTRYFAASCKELTYQEASDFLNNYLVKERGFRVKPKRHGRRPAAPNVVQMVSPQQLALIWRLAADIRWRLHDGRYRMIKKLIGQDRIRTSREAYIVIEALKGMLARQEAPRQ